MTKLAAISASLVDVRNIAAHKCVRLEIHVPAEQAGMVLDAFGWPTAVDPVPVAIARLESQKPASDAGTSNSSAFVRRKERRNFSDLPLPQQAALRCGDMEFREFLREEFDSSVNDERDAATTVRLICGVGSRAELGITDSPAERGWQELDAQFQQWRK